MEGNSIDAIVNGIKPLDQTWIEKARERTARLVMPPRALGRLHDMAERCCGIQKTRSSTNVISVRWLLIYIVIYFTVEYLCIHPIRETRMES